MNYTSERSISMASAGGFRTPGQLSGDVNRRDREWGDWEREGIQSVVNQLGEILTKNYPGNGWLLIQLESETYGNTHGNTVYSGLRSAFGDNMHGLRKAISEVFPAAQWRVKAKFNLGTFSFYFQPLHVPLRWWESWFGWVREIANTSEKLDCSKITAPPTSLRPNMRSTDQNSVDGVSVGSGKGDSLASAQAFAYENLC